MSETSCVNATVAVVGNPTSNKGKGAEVGKQVVELLQEAGRKHGFNVIDVTGESFDDSWRMPGIAGTNTTTWWRSAATA